MLLLTKGRSGNDTVGDRQTAVGRLNVRTFYVIKLVCVFLIAKPTIIIVIQIAIFAPPADVKCFHWPVHLIYHYFAGFVVTLQAGIAFDTPLNWWRQKQKLIFASCNVFIRQPSQNQVLFF